MDKIKQLDKIENEVRDKIQTYRTSICNIDTIDFLCLKYELSLYKKIVKLLIYENKCNNSFL